MAKRHLRKPRSGPLKANPFQGRDSFMGQLEGQAYMSRTLPLFEKLFLNQLSVTGLRLDYLSEKEQVKDLMNGCFDMADLIYATISERGVAYIDDDDDIYNTNAERVGEAGEPTDRPA